MFWIGYDEPIAAKAKILRRALDEFLNVAYENWYSSFLYGFLNLQVSHFLSSSPFVYTYI